MWGNMRKRFQKNFLVIAYEFYRSYCNREGVFGNVGRNREALGNVRPDSFPLD